MFMTGFAHNHTLDKVWRFINLIVGNSKRINCKVAKYRTRVTLAIMTVYIMMFVTGLIVGDLIATKVIEFEKIFGVISTGAVYSMGFSVLYARFYEAKHHLDFASLISAILILTQTAFVFNLFPIEIKHIFYYFASLTTMLFVWSFANMNKQKG